MTEISRFYYLCGWFLCLGDIERGMTSIGRTFLGSWWQFYANNGHRFFSWVDFLCICFKWQKFENRKWQVNYKKKDTWVYMSSLDLSYGVHSWKGFLFKQQFTALQQSGSVKHLFLPRKNISGTIQIMQTVVLALIPLPPNVMEWF